MNKDKVGLQRFPNSQEIFKKALAKFQAGKQFVQEDINGLREKDKQKLYAAFEKKQKSLTDGKDIIAFINKISPVVRENTQNQIWEINHTQITAEISTYLQERGAMPSKTQIALNTGLSRTTVHKHLVNYNSHAIFQEQAAMFKFMNNKVLAKLFSFAVQGNVKAARLFLEMNGSIPGQTQIKNQNNYIQINGTILNQETVQNLKPEQVKLIEDIIKTAVPKIPKLLPHNQIN